MTDKKEKDKYKQHFSERFRHWMKLRKMKQHILAGKLGLTSTYVSAWATGLKIPSYYVFLELCKALELTPDEFLGVQSLKETKQDRELKRIVSHWPMLSTEARKLILLALDIEGRPKEGVLIQ